MNNFSYLHRIKVWLSPKLCRSIHQNSSSIKLSESFFLHSKISKMWFRMKLFKKMKGILNWTNSEWSIRLLQSVIFMYFILLGGLSSYCENGPDQYWIRTSISYSQVAHHTQFLVVILGHIWFLVFIQGHIWFVWFLSSHTRIIYDFQEIIQKNSKPKNCIFFIFFWCWKKYNPSVLPIYTNLSHALELGQLL